MFRKRTPRVKSPQAPDTVKRVKPPSVIQRLAAEETQVLTFELESLPGDVSEAMLKKTYFQGEHVVTAKAEVNTLTGKCNGKAKIKVRMASGLRSDALLKKLYNKGARFKVVEKVRPVKKHNFRADIGPTTKRVNVTKNE